MLESSFLAPTKARSSTSSVLSIVVAALIAIAACDMAASPSLTSNLGSSASAAPGTPSTPVAQRTPDPVRPPGVPPNAQPLLFGCAEDPARCTDLAPGTYYTAGEWALDRKSVV